MYGFQLKMKLESHFLFQEMALNDDLSGLAISYLDITNYTSEEITQIISCMGCDRIDNVLFQWHKASRYETILDKGATIWMLNGKKHRAVGPAVERVNGYKSWWLNGVRHRTDGPAIVCKNGDKSWWMKGKLHRIDGPAVEWSNGDKEWYVKGKLHRTDGPAVECASGYMQWWVNGNIHRKDGPAIEWM